MPLKIEKAQRRQAKLRLAITGPSGSGKTMGALLIAFGIGKKVLVGDTENGSASLYADASDGPLKGKDYDVAIINPPYTIEKYLEVIDAAEKGEYDVLILDSISHAWAGEGGLLQKKEALDSRGGANKNQYTNWAPITKEQEQFKARILNCKVHLVCTMRSKQDYILETKDGKQVPRKVGMAPIQREGMEYEFTAVLDMAMDHSAVASKHRTGKLLDEKMFTPTLKTGKDLHGWLMEGKAPEPEATPPPAVTSPPSADAPKITTGPLTTEQASAIMDLVAAYQAITGFDDEKLSVAIRGRIKKVHQVDINGIGDLTQEMAVTLIKSLTHWCEVATKQKEGKA